MEATSSDGTLSVRDAGGRQLLCATGEALLSDGRVLSTADRDGGLDWTLEPTRDGVVIRLRLRNHSGTPLGLEQLRPLVASGGYRQLPLKDIRIQQTGWQSWSSSHLPAPFEPNLHTAAPPIRGPHLPHRRADSQVETWMTILEPSDGASLLVGFLSARHQLGTIEVAPSQGRQHVLIAATELDGMALEAGAEVASEPLLVASGKTSDLLDVYARRVAEAMDARTIGEVLSGWCSWYQLYTTVSEAAVDRNLQTLLEHREQLPVRLVQLDDGYQRAVGDWLELNEKFPHGMAPLVQRIRNAGFVPGLWLAPFLLSAQSRTYAEHPDWVVRNEHGDPLNAIDNWGTANYAVDTTHPEVLRWLEHVLRTVCEDWGYEYLKLDFLYAAAMRGRRFDPQVTGVEAYRRGLEVLRRAAGERFILGCGAPLVPSIGLVDGMRIGSDVASYWRGEGNSDGPALRNAMRATLARLWMHGRWWSNDPDVVVVRANDSQLTLAEVQAWSAVVALSGGMLFEGDDLSRVEPERRTLLARLLPPSGETARAFPPLVDLMPERLVLRVQRAWGEWYVIGIANWSNAETAARLDPLEAELDLGPYHVFDLWNGAYLGCHARAMDLGTLAPHGMRLLSVHPDLGRPQTIGSNGHLLGEAMDLATEEWDPAAGVLRLVLSDRGPHSRRGEFVVYDPRGPLQRVPFSAGDARPMTLHFG